MPGNPMKNQAITHLPHSLTLSIVENDWNETLFLSYDFRDKIWLIAVLALASLVVRCHELDGQLSMCKPHDGTEWFTLKIKIKKHTKPAVYFPALCPRTQVCSRTPVEKTSKSDFVAGLDSCGKMLRAKVACFKGHRLTSRQTGNVYCVM